MSTQRFTPEFKEEAVRQIVERGYSVAEVSSRLGVSSHSLYQWVKAVKPDKTEKKMPACLKSRIILGVLSLLLIFPVFFFRKGVQP